MSEGAQSNRCVDEAFKGQKGSDPSKASRRERRRAQIGGGLGVSDGGQRVRSAEGALEGQKGSDPSKASRGWKGGRTQGGGGLGGSEGVRRLKGVTGGKRGTHVGGGSGVTGVKSASSGGLEH